jgi:hypothetical protein
MRRIAQIRFAGPLVIVLFAGLCLAQQETPAAGSSKAPSNQQTAPAAQGSSKSGAATPAVRSYGELTQSVDAPAESVETPVPDMRPPSGVLGLTLGSMMGKRNIISLNFNAGQVFDSNPGIEGTQSSFEGATSLGATLNLQHPMRRGDLNLNYQAGAVFYNGHTATNWFPQLNFSVPFALHRWTIQFAENLTYTPESSFGAGLGFANFGADSLGMGGIANGLTPSQSIYTPVSSRLSNTSSVQVQYGLSPRSSWTAAVTYGLLHYLDSQTQNVIQDLFQDTHQIDLRTGYNHSFTARDTVTVFYDYATYTVDAQAGRPETQTDTHSVQLGYARRVTGRLSWSVNAGPQITSGITGDQSANWTLSTAAQYRLRRNAVSFSYLHGVSGGAGVFSGAHSDSLQLGISRTMSRRMSVGLTGDLAKTSNLDGSGEFRSGSAGVQLNRTLGQRMSMYVSYAFQRQVAGGECTGILCSGLSRQTFGFGFSWGLRPWVMR